MASYITLNYLDLALASVLVLIDAGLSIVFGLKIPVLLRYDLSTGKRLVSSLEPSASLRALAFAPDERTLHSLGEDEVLRSWGAATGKEVAIRVEHGAASGVANAIISFFGLDAS